MGFRSSQTFFNWTWCYVPLACHLDWKWQWLYFLISGHKYKGCCTSYIFSKCFLRNPCISTTPYLPHITFSFLHWFLILPPMCILLYTVESSATLYTMESYATGAWGCLTTTHFVLSLLAFKPNSANRFTSLLTFLYKTVGSNFLSIHHPHKSP